MTPATTRPRLTAADLANDGTVGTPVLEYNRRSGISVQVFERNIGTDRGARIVVGNGVRLLAFLDLRENEVALVADALLGLVTGDGDDR